MALSHKLLISVLVGICLLGVAGIFIADIGSTSPDPVPFEDTVTTGVILENEPDEDRIDVPKAQVFYSQYEYVVGYQGIERFVDASQQTGHEGRFGYPTGVYVTDYSGTALELTTDGHLAANGTESWTDAESAWFVVGSEARTPAGETVVPFSRQEDAEAFTTEHGGAVVSWEQLLDHSFEIDDADVVRDRVDERHERGDELVSDATQARDRPTEVVVGEDVATIQEGIDTAPGGATVFVPSGNYNVSDTIDVDRPITVAGEEGTTVQGDGNGTVIRIEDDRAAVTDLQISGVGDVAEADTGDRDLEDSEDVLEMAYGQGDAGIEVNGSERTVVENVSIETPSNGVLLRDSPEAVVRNVTVDGNDHWDDGYMGVMTMRSPGGVIEDSHFRDGRDGIYTHRSHELIYRNNTLEGNRIGVHLMYTSDALIADNRILSAKSTGIDVMTDPEHNAVVGNEIRDTSQGLLMGGSQSYVARNVITDTDVGMTTAAGNSIYERNVIAGNVEGVQANQLLPTNQVTNNDFIGNHRHAAARLGVLRVWTADGQGNYWDGAVGSSDGSTLERSYSPTHPVDERLHRVDGTPTLARSPALDTLTTFEGTVSGMRTESIVDTAPRCEPANPELLAQTEQNSSKYDLCKPSLS
ncbi:right-handed parallel beta-helix repeat-containing protein [Natronococcus sp. A-GB7]|uniref:NosD domain-containing protein n=1 Tax=Natronococcus sp. A-GB7 TaxID=3037649 RepID=UPI00241DFA53|nr:right-handed parallel beta-helix repeat-containing protein [Natronococcus sp. A-GB7]MDG5821559.1 NosD domain-containing protein [Natronococcus sp. A-GB7]